jgi:tetratricopeptide (TPR) repeat protein
MFSRLFTLALLVLADLPVDAAPVLNSDQNRMEETRKEHEEALKTYRELAQKEPETYLPEVAQTLNNLGIVDSAQNRAEEAQKAFAEALKIYREAQKNRGPICLTWRQRLTAWGLLTAPKPGWRPSGRNMMRHWLTVNVRIVFGPEATNLITGELKNSLATVPIVSLDLLCATYGPVSCSRPHDRCRSSYPEDYSGAPAGRTLRVHVRILRAPDSSDRRTDRFAITSDFQTERFAS